MADADNPPARTHLADLPARVFMVRLEGSEGTRYTIHSYPDDDSHSVVPVWTTRSAAEGWLSCVPGSATGVAEGDLPVVVVSLADTGRASHLVVDPPPDAQEALTSLSGCIEVSPPSMGGVLVQMPFESGWAAAEFFLAHQWALHSLLRDYLTRAIGKVPPLDFLGVGYRFSALNEVAAFMAHEPCASCGTRSWKCVSISQDQAGSKWRCGFCDRQRVLKTADFKVGSNSTLASVARARIPKNVQHEVWRRDGGRCVHCGSQHKLEFDHIIAVALNGANTARNVQLLCEACNRAKGAKPPGL